MNFKHAAKTDVGMKRKLNEDSFCVAEDIGLFLVADGMGGHAAGEVASQTAVEVIKNGLTDWLKKGPPGQEIFARAVKLANQAVWEMAQKGSGMKGMGTTMAGILVDPKNGSFTCANVGDSRVYRIRNDSIEQLSTDHSMVGLQLSMGLITKEEAKKSSYRNVITRAVGTSETVEVEAKDQKIASGDTILICSDGLTTLVEDDEVLGVVKRNSNDLTGVCDELISLANFNGGDDNITVVLVKFME